MNSNTRRLLGTFILGLGLALALAWALGGGTPDVAQAQSGTGVIRVAITGTNASGCGSVISPCLTLQYAVDQALPGAEIRVAAGTYTDVQGRLTFAGYPGPGYPGSSLITQVVYISKTVTVRGGYTTTNGFADPPDPVANPTTLDAQGQGRVMVVFGDPAAGPGQVITPVVEGLRITGGDAAGLGGDPLGDAAGGVGVIAATVTISNCRIFSNTAQVAGGVGAGLGGVTLTGNVIAENTADYDGGGVGLSDSAAMLVGNTIISNTSYHDGGGIVTTGSDDVTLIDNDVISNTAYGGGGLYMDTTTATLSNNTFVANAALDEFEGGGGVYLWESNATLSETTVISNIATGSGGGVYLGRNSYATLVNGVVADNRADVAGSGLYVEDASLRLLHVTAACNTGGDGSGVHVVDYVYAGYGIVTSTNTILVGHTVGITVTAGCTATLEATLWGGGTAWANTSNWGGLGTIFSGTHVMTGDPAFVDPDNGDYHLGTGSAAIDQGVNAGVTVDIDGDPRPAGLGYDIGADEFQPEPNMTVAKQADRDLVRAGEPLTYTIRVTNTGNVELFAVVTDTLPTQVTPTGVLTWTPTITAPGGVWTEQVVVTVEVGYSGMLTNEVDVTASDGLTEIHAETSAIVQSCTPLTGVDFYWAPSPAQVDQLVWFTAWVTPSAPASYAWDLGGLAARSGNPVSYTFPSAMTYTVVVTATDGCGESVSASRAVSIMPRYKIYLPFVAREHIIGTLSGLPGVLPMAR